MTDSAKLEAPDFIIANKLQHAAKAAARIAHATNWVAHSRKDSEAEVHIIGQIERGKGFWYLGAHDGFICELSVSVGPPEIINSPWIPLSAQAVAITSFQGSQAAQATQTSKSKKCTVVWNHVIDLHYATNSIADWPRLRVSVYAVKGSQRIPFACGTASLPSEPGSFELEIKTWRPVSENPWEDMISTFTGASAVDLPDTNVVDCKAALSRKAIVATSSGSVFVSGEVVLRKFAAYGVGATGFSN